MSNLPLDHSVKPCRRCKGRRQICVDDDPDMILSCPDCEGTGEELDEETDADREMLGDDADFFEPGTIGNK